MTTNTNIRVDRAASKRTPCGMNSILYMGNNFAEAYRTFDRAETGLSAWGRENPMYGVILSVWDARSNEYIVKCCKGLY